MKIVLFTFLASLLAMGECQPGQQNQNEPARVEEAAIKGKATAYFASGCFWCVEAVYESLKGVDEAISGYSGGTKANPTYEEVGRHTTGHAEAVMVIYDPAIISFETLVKVFYGSQDPTTIGQAPDFGDSYRSIIFYQTDQEKQIAEKAKAEVQKLNKKPVVTEITKFEKFWPAEKYHQNYEKLNPNQPYVKAVSIPRLNRFKAKFPELLKEKEKL